MRIRHAVAACLTTFVLAPMALAAEVTLDSLLNERTDFTAVARWPQPEYSCRQFNSHDRAELALDQPGWFANSDFSQYVRDGVGRGNPRATHWKVGEVAQASCLRVRAASCRHWQLQARCRKSRIMGSGYVNSKY